MSSGKTITVIIDEEGNSSVDLTGFHGQGCAQVMRDFTAGDRIKVERTKQEYHERIQQEQKQNA